jgi:hypothetical protein
MGVFALTVNGVDRTAALQQESIRVKQHLRGRGSTAEFDYVVRAGSPTPPEGGNEVVITNAATREFAGRILIPDFVLSRDPITGVLTVTYHCYCADYTYDLDRYLVYDRSTGQSKLYPSQSSELILQDLITVFTDGSFSTSGIQTGLTVQQQEFDVTPVSECFDKISRETGYLWRVDYTKTVVYAVLEYGIAPIPELNLDTEARIYELKGNAGDASQVKNSIYFKDVPLTSDENVVEYFTGNGVARFFPLSYPPSPRTADVTISAAGVGWKTRFDDQSGFTPNDGRSGTGTAFLCVFNRGLRLESALTAGTIFTATYRRLVPRLAIKEDAASIAEMTRREGLTGILGVHQHVVATPHLIGENETTIRSRMELVLLQYARPQVQFTFLTRLSGWIVGQYLQVLSASLNVNRRMYVQEIEKKVIDGVTGTWEYTVTLIDQLHGDS